MDGDAEFTTSIWVPIFFIILTDLLFTCLGVTTRIFVQKGFNPVQFTADGLFLYSCITFCAFWYENSNGSYDRNEVLAIMAASFIIVFAL